MYDIVNMSVWTCAWFALNHQLDNVWSAYCIARARRELMDTSLLLLLLCNIPRYGKVYRAYSTISFRLVEKMNGQLSWIFTGKLKESVFSRYVHRVAADYWSCTRRLRVCVLISCNHDISKANLLTFSKFIADNLYTLAWKWLTFSADHIQDGWLSAILVSIVGSVFPQKV